MKMPTDVVGVCRICKKQKTVTVEMDDLVKWEEGAYAQHAFPYLSPGDREFLISGICEPCFDELYGDDE